jgi:hypothetical protein
MEEDDWRRRYRTRFRTTETTRQLATKLKGQAEEQTDEEDSAPKLRLTFRLIGAVQAEINNRLLMKGWTQGE